MIHDIDVNEVIALLQSAEIGAEIIAADTSYATPRDLATCGVKATLGHRMTSKGGPWRG